MAWNTRTIGWCTALVTLGAGLLWSCSKEESSAGEDGAGDTGGSSASESTTGGSDATGGGGSPGSGADGGGAVGNATATGGTGGGSDGSGTGGGSDGSGTSGNGGGGSGNGAGGSPLDAGLPDADFSFDATLSDAGLTEDSACGDTTVQAERQYVDMYVILDRSGSMTREGVEIGDGWNWDSSYDGERGWELADCNVGDAIKPSKWCKAVNALGQYFQMPAAEGNRAALHFFPQSSRDSDECPGTVYETPEVTLTDLPAAADGTLIQALNDQAPQGNWTPTEATLRGFSLWADTLDLSDSNRVTVGIVITDGEPYGDCENDADDLASVLSETRNIPVYIIGMAGAVDATLETIAEAGGTEAHATDLGGTLTNTCGESDDPCYHFNVGDGDPDTFAAALQAIQGQAAGCEFALPDVSGTPDWDTVEVEYLPGGVEPAVEPTRVDDESACSGEAWYFDDNTAPTEIRLCPDLCTTVQADPDAQINVLLGCLAS